MLVGAMVLAPFTAAANSREEERVTNRRAIDRSEVENLQRWVSAGHADWCREARLVAAEELKRLAPDYSEEEFELNELTSVATDEVSNGSNRVTLEWAPPDGRTLYRIVVERFDWLLPIAKIRESIVWVPTSTEIRTYK